MEEMLELRKYFPLLVPNETFTKLVGYISVGNEQYFITVEIPNYPSLKDLVLTLSWKLEILLTSCEKTANVQENSSLLTFLLNLLSNIESCLKADDSHLALPSIEKYEQLIHSIEVNNFHDINFISGDLTTFEITALDNRSYEHTLTVVWHVGQSDSLPQVDAELPPCAIEKLNVKKNITFIELHKNFKQVIGLLNGLWETLGEIDENCLVIEPEVRKYSDTHRMIVLEQHVTLLITFSEPFDVCRKPELQFFGPQNAVDHFWKTYIENIDVWYENIPFLENLKRMLGVTYFPHSIEADTTFLETAQQFGIECHICYSILLNGKNPTEVCENEQCKACYHSGCLYKWLSFIAQKSGQFCSILGECPQCGTEILCSMPDLEL